MGLTLPVVVLLSQVADDLSPVTVPSAVSSDVAVVRAEWFWSSIQQVNRLSEDDFRVPPERFRRPPQRGAAYARAGGNTARLNKEDNKENETPASVSAAASPVTPTQVAAAPLHPLRVRNLRRLSMVEVSAWNSPDQDRTLTGSPKTPSGPGTPGTPTTPTTPGLFSDKTCKASWCSIGVPPLANHSFSFSFLQWSLVPATLRRGRVRLACLAAAAVRPVRPQSRAAAGGPLPRGAGGAKALPRALPRP